VRLSTRLVALVLLANEGQATDVGATHLFKYYSCVEAVGRENTKLSLLSFYLCLGSRTVRAV